MAFKSTGVSMTTTPQLIIGGTAAVIDISGASVNDPVEVQLSALTNAIYLQGANTALGAGPALYSLTTAGANGSNTLRLTFRTDSDQIWAGTTVAGGTLFVCGTRQNSA